MKYFYCVYFGFDGNSTENELNFASSSLYLVEWFLNNKSITSYFSQNNFSLAFLIYI